MAMYIQTSIIGALVAGLIGLPSLGSLREDPRPARRLALQIHEVKCIDETNGPATELVGGDEITLSGITVDAAGRAARVSTFRVGQFEKDGRVKRFSPAKEFASFDLRNGPAFPRVYRTMLILVERDHGGGFQKRIDAMVTKANGKAARAAAKPANTTGAVAGTAGAVAGGAVGGIVTESPQGAKVGAEVGKFLFEEAEKLATQWGKDDIAPPQLENVKLPSASHQWHGKDATPVKSRTVKFHGGTYRITYSWRLER
jgi:hypothetical protein